MMRRQRVSSLVFLTDRERMELLRIAEASADVKVRTRARVLLLADRTTPPCATDGEVAAQAGLSVSTVAVIRKRFATEGTKSALYGGSEKTLTRSA